MDTSCGKCREGRSENESYGSTDVKKLSKYGCSRKIFYQIAFERYEKARKSMIR